MFHPEVADRPCDVCRQWLFNENGTFVERGGKRIRRPPNTRLPCGTCPKKSPAEAHRYELTAKNRRAFQWCLEQLAVGGVPAELQTDPIVRRNMRVVKELLNKRDRMAQIQGSAESIAALFSGAVRGRR